MKAALIVPKLQLNFKANIETIYAMANKAVISGATLILFPEASLTGLINNDDPAHDLPLGQEIPGPISEKLSRFCLQESVYLGIGILEREDKKLFDSAVLIDPEGAICLKYRRNHPQWHGRKADPDVYCQGTTIPKTNTDFGSVAFLICGDLFDDDIVQRVAVLQPDWVLYLLARSFEEKDFNQKRWDSQEITDYVDRVKMLGASTLIVNYLADISLSGDFSFGGAWAISKQGKVLKSFPLGTEGMLMIDI